jgi:uncharacterized OsmC-like protein
VKHEDFDVRSRQEPLRKRYKKEPDAALVTDRARTIREDTKDPFHGGVAPGSEDHGEVWGFGVHRGVGGPHDAPVPGDILCAALATCLDSTIRMVANHLKITLEALQVEVTGDVDLRGCLLVDQDVPVGFQKMQCRVQMKPVEGTEQKLLKTLIEAAEHSCKEVAHIFDMSPTLRGREDLRGREKSVSSQQLFHIPYFIGRSCGLPLLPR